jgi:actin-related protein
LKHVFITGGNTKRIGFYKRISNEIRQLSRIDERVNIMHRYSTNFLASQQSKATSTSSLNVPLKDDPSLDAWMGAAKFANDKLNEKNIEDFVLTKKYYEECGPNYLKEHRYANKNYF